MVDENKKNFFSQNFFFWGGPQVHDPGVSRSPQATYGTHGTPEDLWRGREDLGEDISENNFFWKKSFFFLFFVKTSENHSIVVLSQ